MKVSKRIFDLETESAFAILAKANKLLKEGKDIINLSIGQPDFQTPINIQEAAIKAIKDGHHGYTDSNGMPQLREALSEKIALDYNNNSCLLNIKRPYLYGHFMILPIPHSQPLLSPLFMLPILPRQ